MWGRETFLIQAIAVMLGFYIALQAAVAFESPRASRGLKFLAALTFVVAMLSTCRAVA